MLFDIKPKSDLKDLFDREEEIMELGNALDHGEPYIIIYGVRRIGKTSLMKAFLTEYKYPYVLIDVREIYNEYGSISRLNLYEQLARFFTNNMELYEKLGFKVKDLLRRVRAFRISGFSIEVDTSVKLSITRLLRAFNNWAKSHNTRFIIAIDEAQYLRFSGATRYDGLFAWAYDNLDYLTIIVTGSEVGVLRDFLKLDDPRAPLYGRHVREIMLRRFTQEQSMLFLKNGFEEIGKDVSDDELGEVISMLDGIPGWLTLYGYYRGILGIKHKEALSRVFETGTRLVADELDKIISPSRNRYLAILEALVRGATRWREIKTYVEYRTRRRIADKNFTDLLKKLIKHSIIEKKGNEYKIVDPMIEYAIRSMVSKK